MGFGDNPEVGVPSLGGGYGMLEPRQTLGSQEEEKGKEKEEKRGGGGRKWRAGNRKCEWEMGGGVHREGGEEKEMSD